MPMLKGCHQNSGSRQSTYYRSALQGGIVRQIVDDVYFEDITLYTEVNSCGRDDGIKSRPWFR